MMWVFDLRNVDVAESLAGKVKVTLGILTDDGLLMMASNVVPFDSVSVEVVENGQASLFLS